jgi:hypothetical protein
MNDEGCGWLRRVKNDSKKAVYITLPSITLFLLIYGLSQSNFRPSLALLVIIPPLLMFWYGLFYLVLIKRGEKVKKVIDRLSFEGESVKLCTSNWLYSSGQEYKVSRDLIKIEKNHFLYMQQENNYRITFPSHEGNVELYFIPHFIQNGSEALSLLGASQ